MLFQDAHDIENILNHQFLFLAQGYYEDRASLRHKSGRISMARIEALLLADEANQMVGFMVLVHEAQWQEAGAGTERLHQLMSRERLATMGEMAAQLAHELRNPLVSIGATIEMLSREEGRDQESREILGTLSAEVSHMDTLLKDYLSLAARRNAPVTTINLASVLDDAKRLLRGAREADGKEIINLLPGDLQILADYDGMRHVFLNLLRNALEATPPGRKVTCHSSANELEIKICVDDEGTGLTHPASECFKSFFTTKKNGTGLGLTVCQKTVQAYGGTLSLGNLELGGCRATIVLPRKARR
jgi:signal transduction histidine kinase